MREIRFKNLTLKAIAEVIYLLVFHVDVSTLACTRCVLHSVSSISPTKRQCEDLDALYIYYICLPAQVEDSISEEAGRSYRNQ